MVLDIQSTPPPPILPFLGQVKKRRYCENVGIGSLITNWDLEMSGGIGGGGGGL